MKEYSRLLMGLVGGFALILLNTSMVHGAINSVFTLFKRFSIDSMFFMLGEWVSMGCILLSFLGIIVVIYFSFLLLKKVIFNKEI